MVTTLAAVPLQLRLVVQSPDGVSADVEVEAPADCPVHTVVEALAQQLGVRDSPVQAFCVRTRTWLSDAHELGAAGLCHGDRLILAAGRSLPDLPTERAHAEVELAVVGGSEAGRRVALPPGEHTIGRDPTCTISFDDPSLSARHLILSVEEGGGATVEDDGSRNGTAIEGQPLPPHEPHRLEPGEVVQAGRTLVAVERAVSASVPQAAESTGFVPFNRPPRVNRPLTPVTRSFPAPPQDPHRPRLPWGMSLVPLALGIGLYAVTRLPMMLFFALLMPVMALSTFIEDRKSGKGAFRRGSREYRRRLAGLRDELQEAGAREARERRAASPSAPEIIRRARERDPALWERRVGDPDFLSLRLGSGEQPSHLTVQLEPGGNEGLRAEVEKVTTWYSTVTTVPVVMPLAEIGAVGLCGPAERVDLLARWLVAQAAALHSPRELVISAALSPERLGSWEWLKWLPHTRSETTPLPVQLATGELGARDLLEAIATLLEERRAEAEGTFGASARRSPFVLVVLDEVVAPERPLVGRALAGAAEQGVAAVWLGRARRDLPGECGAIVELDPGSMKLAYTEARSGTTARDVTADGLAPDLARELALTLAPVRDTSAVKAGERVPDRVMLLDLLEVDRPTGEWIAERWTAGAEPRAAVVGSTAERPFSVDLRRDGPHALIAGTTGAGKSELLQTLISSLAVSHPPTSVSFLLVDYKGGAAFKDCVGLPHTVGFVTDLDGHLAQRALVSLNAELRRRERLLKDAGAKDLPDMEQRDPERAPASLVIMIDEFATLAKEVPEFVDGVVDVAQRGRSLGVHLVLATQRPGGVVSENIRANTNLRIALRVNQPSESTDVIGTADAARIARDRPGRAYARTGHSELTEFQTAYVGGVSGGPRDERGIVVRALPFESERARRLAAGNGRPQESDLRRLVEAAAEAAHALDLPRPPSPWLPPLGRVVPLESLPAPEADEAVVGLLDEPTLQRQSVYALDLESEGSVLVYGTSGSGKTTLLRTLALSLARRSSPEELNLYGLDFATRGLQALEQLPHCGSVIAGEDEERVARLFSMLRKAMERRKALFAEHGVFTLSEYRRAARGGEPLARILVLIDNYAGFATAFERVNLGQLVDTLPRLVGDGRPLGVHFAIAADRRGAIPNSLAGIIPAKIMLRLADEDEFSAFGIPLKTIRGAQFPPGRGFLPSGVELQVALLGDNPSGEGQAAALGALADELRARWPEAGAPPVAFLPTRVERAALPRAEQPLTAVLGLSDAELGPVAVDLGERHFLVTGTYRSGRSTTLRTLAESLRESTPSLALHLLAPRRSPLVDLGLWSSVARGIAACEERAGELRDAVEAGGTEGFVVVIDDGDELAETLGAQALETIVRRGRDEGVRVVAAAERVATQRAFAGWLRELRKDEHGLLLDPDTDTDGDILGVRLPRRSNPVFPPGRGYLVERGNVELIQVATDTEAV